MNLSWYDWSISGILLILMIVVVLISKRYMRSVADFLSAGRTAGRYLVSVAEGMGGLGSITIIANFEMNYQAGFALTWWGFTMFLFVLIITVSGWVVYRFRETRALTMAQFFEMRYSRRFRIFAGILAFIAGIINFGIFPSVGANFFIYYGGLPQTFSLLGLEISTYAFTMIVLLSIAIFFVFAGGQIAVMLTDFLQGIFVNIVFIVLVVFLLFSFTFDHLFQGLLQVPADASKINPFHTSQAQDFNFWYFLIGVVGVFYNKLSWQGTQAFNSSAKSAHEAKMGQVLSNWRGIPMTTFLLFVPICIYAILHHPDFASQTSVVNSQLDAMSSNSLRSQMRVPVTLLQFLPLGLLGAFAAIMLSSFITCHDTYLHSWGSIFVQDFLMPLRKKPLTPKQHIRILRLAIIGVAIFIFFFSLLFKQTQYINMFFAITAALFVGGAGAVIIGGLYWKKGTSAGAWSAMFVGSATSVVGIIILYFDENFFINGQWFYLISMVGAMGTYVVISLLTNKNDFNLNKMLHRGSYAIEGEHQILETEPVKGWRVFGINKEFSRKDKLIYILTYVWVFSWVLVFIIGTIYYFTAGISDKGWMQFWYVYIWIQLVVAVLVTCWFGIGGVKNIIDMLKMLKVMKRDERDNGRVFREE